MTADRNQDSRMTRSEVAAMLACLACTGLLGVMAVFPRESAQFLMGLLP